MTENIIWFAVSSDKKPTDTDNIHDIKKTKPLKDADRLSLYYYKPELRVVKRTKWYKGTTYFKHIEALRDIANQFGEDLLFFGFSCHDCDFRGNKK